MGKALLTVLDAVHTKVDRKGRELILPCLKYEDVQWRRKRFGSDTTITKRHLITGNKNTGGTILTGLIPRVLTFARQSGFFVSVRDGNIDRVKPSRRFPRLTGITFRSDQRRALRAIRKHQRGVIKAPTGSGKTIIALGAFSMFENSPRLFLCHTKDLLTQTVEEISLLPETVELFALGGGYKPSFSKIKNATNPIVVSTIQTFSKYDPSEWADYFDMVIVDECHRVGSKTSQYGTMMEYNLAPIRIGVSATPHDKGKEQLICEGMFGPIIAQLGMEEGIKKKIIAKPEVNLIPVPYDHRTKEKCGKTYKATYKFGIMKNRKRNRLIIDETMRSLKKNDIVLIIIENTEHGKILQRMLKLKGVRAPFVHGGSDKATRSRVKSKLKSKQLKVAICSKVWREGVNIPSLNNIILAHGMKSEKIVLQAMGRGLRTSEGKEIIRLTDFLDPYRYLAEHTVMRVCIYRNQSWI